MKLPQTPSWAKLLCACFACLLLGACASLSLSALQLFSLYGTSSTDGGVAGSSVAEDYCKDAWDLFVLSQHKKSLTYLGNQRRDALTEQLDLDNTNFRYRILDMNGLRRLRLHHGGGTRPAGRDGGRELVGSRCVHLG